GLVVREGLSHVLAARKYSNQPGKGLRWDPEWWRYPEVAARLESLWRAWEVAYAEGGGAMSKWWVYDFDAHMRVILDGETGPFHLYDADRPAPPLRTVPVVEPPAGWRYTATTGR
ncbi:MAG: DUF4913 domain-containing protein, partial [Tomitella sp.]|nr:DUF4913 domain-containing protein [Tomitella sp.]